MKDNMNARSPADQAAAPLNAMTRACLEALRERAKPRERERAGYYLLKLDQLWYDLCNIATEERAAREWIIHDENALRALFRRYELEQKFDIPVDDCDLADEPWAMALQLGYESVVAQPPPLPTFSRQAIEDWLKEPTTHHGQLQLPLVVTLIQR